MTHTRPRLSPPTLLARNPVGSLGAMTMFSGLMGLTAIVVSAWRPSFCVMFTSPSGALSNLAGTLDKVIALSDRATRSVPLYFIVSLVPPPPSIVYVPIPVTALIVISSFPSPALIIRSALNPLSSSFKTMVSTPVPALMVRLSVGTRKVTISESVLETVIRSLLESLSSDNVIV